MDNESPLPQDVAARPMGPVFKAAAKFAAVFVAVIIVSFWLFAPACACQTREDLYVMAMKHDLRSLQRVQSSYHADHGTYAASLSALRAGISAEESLQPTLWVTVVVDAATRDGFSAHASHPGTPVRCVILEGNMIPPDPANNPDEVDCSKPPMTRARIAEARRVSRAWAVERNRGRKSPTRE